MEGVEAWSPGDHDGVPWIASVGHSDHSLDAFFGLLEREQVRALVDVRSFPRSHVQHFNKESLVDACRGRGIAYHHLADLGGKRSIQYPEHMQGTSWIRAYRRLRTLALGARHEGGLLVFMCVERDPGACHRRFIAARLEKDGWRVRHLLPDPAQARLF